jgi:hypothetical protein
MKQAKFLWLVNPSQMNGDNLSKVKCKASRHFRKQKEYLKDKIFGLKTNVRTEVLQISTEA